jgi:aspartyl-tRNA(Asn)/glutamyl-tRNA(Gln) amidotransferase subunit A
MKRERFRGPLQGIPYGAKDLLAYEGQPTTWGAKPYAGQVFDFNATVIKKLDAVGSVLTGNSPWWNWRAAADIAIPSHRSPARD